MNLPVIEPLTYISPSTFLSWMNCQYNIYVEKMSGLLRPSRTMGRPARIGILFDAYVKDLLIRERRMDMPHCNVAFEIKQIKPEDDEIDTARDLAMDYAEKGCWNRLVNAKELFLQRTLYTSVQGVPLLGKLDADVDGVVFDWKTRGFGKNPTSPTAGYNKRIHFKRGEQSEHPDRTLLAVHKPDWAIQMLFYNWMKNNNPIKYIIHEIVNTSHGIVFVEHEDILSQSFSESTMIQVQQMWATVNGLNTDIEEPRPNSFRCEKYGQLCNSAVNCTKYQETLGGNEREFYS